MTAPGIAHPGLAQIAREAFDSVMRGSNQLDVLRNEVDVSRAICSACPDGEITENGLRGCIRVGVQYIEAWLRGSGCVPLYISHYALPPRLHNNTSSRKRSA